MAGMIDHQIIEAFRREHAGAERSDSTFRRVQSKNNLGSALLNMANAAASPAEYVSMYQESEELLLAALKLQPSNVDAKNNLEAVRKNRSKRPWVADIGGDQRQPGDGVRDAIKSLQNNEKERSFTIFLVFFDSFSLDSLYFDQNNFCLSYMHPLAGEANRYLR
jgi:hypothetical protein